MKNNYKPLIVAVFLVVVGLVSGNIYSSDSGSNTVEVPINNHYSAVLIGVAEAQDAVVSDSAALVQNGSVVIMNNMANYQVAPIAPIYADAAIQDPGQPIGQTMDPSQNSQYKVKKGDTLSGVAAHFNVSAATILSANTNIRKKSLQIGAVITIPGIANSVKTANTIQGVSAPKLPNFKGNFIMPAQGYNYGILDSNNGVNIVNSCGTPVIAAADGIVVPDKSISDSLGGWNNGYGNFVLVEHAFGNDIFTRYAHLEQPLVQIGAYVKQGEEIGLIGQTGGVSACELDFEVIGAQNPFAK